jgi:GDP-L-fucose synthase
LRKSSRIYIAGHRGLAGSALVRRLEAAGYTKLITRTHAGLELENQSEVEEFFAGERPEYVFLAAAKVGGIWANNTFPADFILNNLKIQNNVIEACWRYGIKGLLFLGSSCIYPKLAPQPLKEDYLLSGLLEPTNEPYAVAKIAGIKLCESFNRQYGTRFLSVMPTNLYGANDNYDLENSHVFPALIRKFHLAKLASRGEVESIKRDERTFGPIPDDFKSSLGSIAMAFGHSCKNLGTLPSAPDRAVTLWGSGHPRREFLCSDDLADACIFLMERLDRIYSSGDPSTAMPLFNVGCGEDLAICELAEIVRNIVGFGGEIQWDATKPDGTPRKLLDIGRLTALGWKPRVDLYKGIRLAYRDFLEKTEQSIGRMSRRLCHHLESTS